MNVDKRLVKAILAMKPGIRAMERRQILFTAHVAQQRESGQCGVGHRDRLDRLLIV